MAYKSCELKMEACLRIVSYCTKSVKKGVRNVLKMFDMD